MKIGQSVPLAVKLLAACLALAAATAAAAVSARRAAPPDAAPRVTSLQDAVQQGAAPSGDGEGIEAEVIALTPRGCEPAEITRPRGRFLLSVHNRTGKPITTLEVVTERGARLYDLPGRQRRLSWARLIDPPAGSYVLRAAGHPDLACRVTITNR